MIERLEELDQNKPIHLIGIGGCGMSGVALTLRSMGYTVSGSDMNDGATLARLRQAGIAVAVGHNGGNIPSGAQLVVASAAIAKHNPEYMAAEVRGIPLVKYARMLGILMRARQGIAVAGTHGKTTTTAMVALALRELGADPGFVVGGDVPQLGGGSGMGSSAYLVAEACEFDRSFLSLWPRYAIINNIEEDHLDYYSGLEEIIGAFRDFALRLPPDGLLVYGASSPNIARFIREAPCRTVACALDREADYWAHDIRYERGRSVYRLKVGATPSAEAASCDVELAVFGRHNVVNSLVAIALVHQLGFPLDDTVRAVGKFRGVRRRFEIVHDENDVCIVDDYAHHPTEVQTVLKSSKIYFGGRRVIAVFQPHQHSRTRFLLKDFARSFQYADLVVVPDIYFVRDSETEREMVHARDLVREIVGHGGNAVYIPSFAEIEQFLANNVNRGDVLLTMGAGNVWEVGAHLAQRFSSATPTHHRSAVREPEGLTY
ncbi:UDP-N-acetylmuramate--L-alanine ligase [Candidatus Sumerlaeota bacterium]|nr:UDP-N-acetylmuramate--L-alanine ligase [Candidatus Sumerlaeota bacterium]